MQNQEKQLFAGYEIKNWNFTPRIYKILGASAAINLLAILVFAQTDILTMRGCDSPLVSPVCTVLDTIYVGNMILGTDSEYVSRDYQKTELEDADITYIDVSGETPPLEYPPGYFALANPEQQFAAMPNMDGGFSTMPPPDMSGFPPNPTISNPTDLMAQPQVTPTPNNNAVTGTIPDKPFDFGGTNPTLAKRGKIPRIYIPKPPKMKNNSPKELPKLDGDETAEKKGDEKKDENQADKTQTDVKSDAVAEIEINKKPFEELGDALNVKLEKKEVDLSKPFSVVLDGTIAADGTLDFKKSRFVKFEGDKQMIDVAKDAIEAVGDSRFLAYLKNQGVERVIFSIVQDDKQIYIKIISDQKTPEKASTTASGLNAMLSAAKAGDAMGIKKLDENSKTLIGNSKVTSEGKNFVSNFAIPKTDAQVLINRSLKERADKKAAQQPNSTAQNDDANEKTAK